MHAPAALPLERRHLRHRIDLAIAVGLVLDHVRRDVDGHVLVLDALVAERDAHALAGRAAPIAVELHPLTTFWAIRPHKLRPSASSISISTRSPIAMNGVDGRPSSMVSIMRRSARHEIPRLR